MAKQLLLTLVCAFMMIEMSAQVIIDMLPVPEPGDTIERFLVSDPSGLEISAPGPDQMWEWMFEDGVRFVYRAEANDQPATFPGADIVLDEGFRQFYIDASPESWDIVGLIGTDPIGFGLTVTSFYDPALPDVYAPLEYGDSTFNAATVYTGIPKSIIPDSVLATLPVVPDSIRAAISFQQEDKIDAWGELSINGNSQDVLRQYRKTRFAARIEAKISILPWTDVTGFIIDFLPPGVNISDTLYEYRFMAPGDGWPVAIVDVDETNTPLNVEYSEEITLPVFVPGTHLQQLVAYPNPSAGNLTIGLPQEIVGKVNTVVYDQQGVIQDLRSLLVSGNTITLDPGVAGSGLKFILLSNENGEPIGVARVFVTEGN